MPQPDPAKIMKRITGWSEQGDWGWRRAHVFAAHVIPVAKAFGLHNHEVFDLVDGVSNSLFAYIMEDFLTTGFGDEGETTAIGSYLERYGWREDIRDKRYLQALDVSKAMLYEVCDRGPGGVAVVGNLLLVGPPVTVADSDLPDSMGRGDRFAGRLLDVDGEMRLARGFLYYSSDMAEGVGVALAAMVGRDVKRTGREAERSAEEDAEDIVLPPPSFAQETCRVMSKVWLISILSRILADLPRLRNSDGEELIFSDIRFPLQVDAAEVAAVLDQIDAIEKGPAGWLWRNPNASKTQKPKDAGEDAELEPRRLSRESTIGIVRLESDALVLSVNSKERAERGRDILTSRLGRLAGSPQITRRGPGQSPGESRPQISGGPEPGRDDRSASPQVRGKRSIRDRLLSGRMRRVTGWFSDD